MIDLVFLLSVSSGDHAQDELIFTLAKVQI